MKHRLFGMLLLTVALLGCSPTTDREPMVVVENVNSDNLYTISLGSETGLRADNSLLAAGDQIYFEPGSSSPYDTEIVLCDSNSKELCRTPVSIHMPEDGSDLYFYVYQSSDGSLKLSSEKID